MLTAICYATDSLWVGQEPDGMKLQMCAIHNQTLICNLVHP